jgi:uncharacterized membrane protein YgaE (UPF0421/DUF939 family)
MYLKHTINRYGFINSLKTLFACLLGFTLARVFHLNQPQWVLISILIVMAAQYRLGAAMIKGYARLIATIIGSALAAALLFLFSSHPTFILTILFICIGVFIYLASNSKDFAYSYTIGAVTMVVILVSNNPQISSAMDRAMEIILGVVIGILVSRFILPIHATKILHTNIASTLKRLKELYQLSIREEKTFNLRSVDTDLEENIIKNFTNQPTLLKEACIESITIRQNRFKYLVLLRLERRLLRSVYLLHFTLRVSLKHFGDILSMAEFKILHKQIIDFIADLSGLALDPNYQIQTPALNNTYNEIIAKLRTTFDQYSFENKNKIHAFIFCLGHVIRVLNRINKILLEIAQTKR